MSIIHYAVKLSLYTIAVSILLSISHIAIISGFELGQFNFLVLGFIAFTTASYATWVFVEDFFSNFKI